MTPEEQTVEISLLKQQVGRMISDYESEKGTRARMNAHIGERFDKIDSRQQRLERIIYMGMGGLAVLQFFLSHQ